MLRTTNFLLCSKISDGERLQVWCEVKQNAHTQATRQQAGLETVEKLQNVWRQLKRDEKVTCTDYFSLPLTNQCDAPFRFRMLEFNNPVLPSNLFSTVNLSYLQCRVSYPSILFCAITLTVSLLDLPADDQQSGEQSH